MHQINNRFIQIMDTASYGNQLFFKVFGLIRYGILHFRRGVFHGIGLVGRRARISIAKNGRLHMGDRVILADDAELQAIGQLHLGKHIVINRFSRIVAVEKITVGDNVTVAQFVSILDHDHKIEKQADGTIRIKGYETAPIVIGSNIWIGDKVSILKGVTIGDNVVIGAHSLINKDIPSNCVVAGNPARIIKEL